MEKVVKLICENCGATIYIHKNEHGKFEQETIVPKKAHEDEKKQDDEQKKGDWFDEI